jgi:hypothetical protein
MAADKTHNLTVKLGLNWLQGNEYEATVAVTLTDSCYHEGDLTIGLPPGRTGIPEVEYLAFNFTHVGQICSDIVRTVEKSIQIPFSNAKPTATAFAVVNGKVAGEDTKPFPRRG